MFHRQGAASLAAGFLVACATIVSAAEPQLPKSSGLSLDKPVYLAETGPADTTLMGLADKAGMGKTLSDNGLTVGGWVQGSWTWNGRDTQFNNGRVFDFEAQDMTLNQVVIFVDKAIDWTKNKQFQLGGRMEWMWGGDARLIHSNGLFDHYGLADGPDEQFDLTQLYADIFLPVGSGLNIRVGKFVTLLGSETINPNTNLFYSHSYLFGYAIPFTHTGVMGTYNLSDAWAVDFGFSRGWEQSLEDNNGCAIDIFGRVTWNIDPKKATKLYVTGIGGPERAGNSEDYRYVLDVIFTTKLADQLTLTLNADFGFEDGAADDGDDASWYGIAGYLTYSVNEWLAVNVRGEWFQDADNSRGLGTDGSVYEATLGLDIKPFASNKNLAGLRFRPEIRYDYAEDGLYGNDGDAHDQFTFGIDAIFSF